MRNLPSAGLAEQLIALDVLLCRVLEGVVHQDVQLPALGIQWVKNPTYKKQTWIDRPLEKEANVD